MEQETLRSALRDRTRGQHARLDASLRGEDGVHGYVRMLRVLHTLHTHADAALARWVRTSRLADGLDPDLVPDRAVAYAADLRAVGATVPAPPRQQWPSTVSDARGLALLYLVAGSAAGARIILRDLPASVPPQARSGLVDASGAGSTRLWREARTRLARPLGTELQDAVVDEATEVFDLLIDSTALAAS